MIAITADVESSFHAIAAEQLLFDLQTKLRMSQLQSVLYSLILLLFVIGKAPTVMCYFCGEVNTTRHEIFECA